MFNELIINTKYYIIAIFSYLFILNSQLMHNRKNMKCFTKISIKYLMISEGQKIEHYFESGKFNKEICIVVTGQKSKVKS